MKNLLFGLIATVLFSFSGNAQKTQEELRLLLANEMVSFTKAMKPAYDQAKDFEEFKQIVCGDWTPTSEGKALLNASYNLISKKISDASIIKSYSGKEMAAVALLHNENLKKDIKSSGIEIFGGTTGDFNPYTTTILRGDGGGCRWWQVKCWLTDIFGEDGANAILTIVYNFLENIFNGQ